MPLPTADQPWPPPSAARLTDDFTTADAWWSGDPAKLAAAYGSDTTTQRPRPRRSVSDLFWGRPATDPRTGAVRERVHVPVAADIASTGADLLFGDDLVLQVPEAHGENPDADAKKAQDYVADLTDRISLGSTLLEAAELCGALGGVYLRPAWDPATPDPILSVIHADRAVPEWRYGQLVALTIWSEVGRDGNTVWRHLERHEMVVTGQTSRPAVQHGLFVGTTTHLGTKTELKRHPKTEALAASVNDKGYLKVPDGIDGLMVRYVPNVRPNRRHRHQPIGRPDTQGAEALMSALDETFTSWMRDLRLGQRRIIVPDQYLQRGKRGEGATFDLDQEVFSPLNIDPGSVDAGTITPVDFALRTDDHDRTARALLERIVATAQYSPQSFGLAAEGGGAQTATEVVAKENRSVRTTGRKRRYWGGPYADCVYMLQVIDREVLKRTDVIPHEVRVPWPDLDSADLRDVASSLNLINLAKAASTETRVRMLHPDWEETEITEEAARILAEDGAGVGDPTGGFPG